MNLLRRRSQQIHQRTSQQSSRHRKQPHNSQNAGHRQTAYWLAAWTAIALAIRLSLLGIKAPWMDEVATTLFSLGNSSRLIPLNEIISLETVLRPLQYTPGATIRDVVQHLLAEDNHPPTYFVLAHWWMRGLHWLGMGSDGYAALWAARALSAIFGALAVPGIYELAWLSSRQRLSSRLCAVLMAVSPFGVFLSQEARHYTLGTLTVIASLCCLVVVTQALQAGKTSKWSLLVGWVVINTVGLSVHYFFGLTLIAAGLTLLVLLIQQCRQFGIHVCWKAGWLRVHAAAVGTLAGALLWLPLLLNFYGSPQTSFLKRETSSWSTLINPVIQSLAGWFYTVLSPITNGFGWQSVTAIVVSCVLLLLVYAPWLTLMLGRSLNYQYRQPQFRQGIQILGGFFLAANLLFFLVTYATGFDITRGHRYTFVFSPSLVVLVGMGLTPYWQQLGAMGKKAADNFSRVRLPATKYAISGRTFVILVICIAFAGAQTIVFKRSNLKFYKADRIIGFIQAESSGPVLIADSALITPQPMVIGLETMAIAWEIHRRFNPDDAKQNWQAAPQFLLLEKTVEAKVGPEKTLQDIVRSHPYPFDLWLLGDASTSLNDLGSQVDLSQADCQKAETSQGNRGSFPYTHYVCQR
ncbi:MAG: hypothetical protein AAFQ74_13375 [Cyanobacteria bacterium J06623_4]